MKTTWWSNVVYTNDDGYYIVDRRYKDIPTVKLWNRNQTNKTTQRWTENIDFWVKGTINNAIVIYADFSKNGDTCNKSSDGFNNIGNTNKKNLPDIIIGIIGKNTS
ncbi:hypothetical protein J5U18_13625 [Sphingobacteriaceae bacterium WQ 2009]|uniref:Uncharacterized protein n=1 Tax=Rhinopithecimicrobium faecis TaxID=2820698 RepID=A0A8T4HDN2_9SPHI|nr:hypothetical protein [Sphingobacteriaceae bacterium WQ 2009]